MTCSVDMENPRYQRTWARPFGELCTRMRMENGEKINGISCCYGLTSDRTDDYEKECKSCEHFLAWN